MTYTFKVAARNVIGISTNSTTVEMLAATKPLPPLYLTNDDSITTGYQVGIYWSSDYAYTGSPTIDYSVSYAE